MLPLFFCGCNYGGDDNDYIPIYQDAIYIMDADGSNKQKVIDVDNCDNVQFIQDSNKLLYRADNSLFTVNEDGTENTKISGELNVRRDLPAISDDGEKIAFAVYYDSRDYIYDLYITEPTGNEISNLTNSANVSEKEATFIQYQNQEFLLYVTYFNNRDVSYSTVSKMNLANSIIDTCYIKELYNLDYANGFSDPKYDENTDNLFVFWGSVDGSIYQYSSVEDGFIENEFIANGAIPYYSHELSQIVTKLLYYHQNDYMTLFDYTFQISTNYEEGYNFTLSEDTILYTDSRTGLCSIYSIKFDGLNKNLLTEDSMMPRFNEDAAQIVYIGQYITNPVQKNLITN